MNDKVLKGFDNGLFTGIKSFHWPRHNIFLSLQFFVLLNNFLATQIDLDFSSHGNSVTNLNFVSWYFELQLKLQEQTIWSFSSSLKYNIYDFYILWSFALRKKCPYSELFWSAFSLIRTEYGDIQSISLYSVQMRKNADWNNAKYGRF